MGIKYLDPDEIQKKSFEIIRRELSEKGYFSGPKAHADDERAGVTIRCIHTTADLEYADTLEFSDGAVDTFRALVKESPVIVTDTNMALAGINKIRPEKYGCRIRCFMADKDVAAEAKARGITRASVSMERAMALPGPVIFVIGNAPTALITLYEHIRSGAYVPAFVIGAPVGFVNVVEAKEMIASCDIPYIINRGRKGGSPVAAAIVNALFETL